MTRRASTLLLALCLLGLTACAESSAVSWRDVELVLPAGWVVTEESAGVLTVADGRAAPSPGAAGERTVLAQFLVVEGTGPQPWRDLVTSAGGVLEQDVPVDLAGAAGTRLTWRWTTNGIPTREMIVVVPSRNLEILFQPIALAGQSDAPDIFNDARDEFEAILESLVFGAPHS